MSTKNSKLVRVFDREYRIAGQSGADGDNPSSQNHSNHIEEAASYLDETMRRMAGAARRRSPLDLAILAAMEIAREVLSVRSGNESLLDEADEQIGQFTRRLDDQFDH